MSAQSVGTMLDGLGVTLNIGPNQRVASVLVIAKVVDLSEGSTMLTIGSNDLDWVEQGGLLLAAQDIRAVTVQNSMSCTDPECEEDHG